MKVKMVNANPDVIEQIYFKRDWQKILKQRNNIRIPTDNPLTIDNYVHDQPDSIWEVIDRDGIKVHDNATYLSRIQEDPKSILENPTDIFFVDRNIKKKYLSCNSGVLVNSQKLAPTIPLKAEWSISPKGGECFSWGNVFRSDVLNRQIPSNALVLVDRYMFAKMGEGIQNLADIMESILPATLNGDYHILIISDHTTIKEDKKPLSPEEAATRLQCIVPSLNRPYDIVFEIIMVERIPKKDLMTPEESAQLSFYDDTHNRRIFSNYFIVSAEHGMNAVRTSKKGISVATYEQNIKFESIYAGVDNKFQDLNFLPIKRWDDFIRSVGIFIKGDSPLCHYFINGIRGDIHNIKNRLIK